MTGENDSEDECNAGSFGQYIINKQRNRKNASHRIKRLAEPKHGRSGGGPPVNISVQRSGAAARRGVTIIRKPRISSRLEQLALPTVRLLITNRQLYKCLVGRYWLQRFNKNIYKSMFTIYSRLANIKLPEMKQPEKKWNDSDWNEFEEWAKKNAAPKKYPPPEKLHRKKGDLSKIMTRVDKLAQPKHTRTKYTRLESPHLVTEKSLKYEPTDRIIQLSAPPERYLQRPQKECSQHCISPGALLAKPTEHTTELARPKKNFEPELPEENLTIYGIRINALKAVPTERIIQLAQPRET